MERRALIDEMNLYYKEERIPCQCYPWGGVMYDLLAISSRIVYQAIIDQFAVSCAELNRNPELLEPKLSLSPV